MKLNFAQKSLSKKALNTQVVDLPSLNSSQVSLRTLLRHLVTQQVSAYYTRQQNSAEHVLEGNYLDTLIDTGKVGFGDTYNDKKIDIDEAIANALQSYEDGLYAVFIGEEHIEQLDTELTLDEKTVISFVRLTFLAGSYW